MSNDHIEKHYLMPKWVYAIIGIAFSCTIFAVTYRILLGDGGSAELSGKGIKVNVPPARIQLAPDATSNDANSSSEEQSSEDNNDTLSPEESVGDEIDSSGESSIGGVETSDAAVALVFDPPSNIRATPNGKILCSVTSKGSIRIYDENNGWYQTDTCGSIGVIHSSQISFNPDSIK